jgi:phosphohistidine swiveling domain-containing protein
VAPGLLGVVAEAIGEPHLPMTLLSSIGDVDSADANYALWKLSRLVRDDEMLMAAFDDEPDSILNHASPSFLRAWDDFIVEFGSRGPDEWDLRSPTWETHPRLLLAALDRVRLQSDDESPHARHDQNAARRDEMIDNARLALADKPDVAPLLDLGLTAGKMMAHRERTKTTIVRVLHEARVAFRELGRRHGHDESIFQLLDAELDDYVADPTSFTGTLEQRRAEWLELFDLEPPFIIANATVEPLRRWARKSDKSVAVAGAGQTLSGVAGSPGIARGIARVVLDPAEPGDLGPGDILVAPCTDPSWTPLFMTSAAVVSRELGVPCVVSVTDATERIPDGALIEVDGDSGVVTIVR